MDGDKSSNNSNFFLNIITNNFNNVDEDIMSTVIRKLAHFTEFFILGGYLWFLFKNKISYLFAVIVAIIDEIIQIFTPGRTAKVLDVLIDSLGSLLGFICVMIIFYKISKYKEKNKTIE